MYIWESLNVLTMYIMGLVASGAYVILLLVAIYMSVMSQDSHSTMNTIIKWGYRIAVNLFLVWIVAFVVVGAFTLSMEYNK